MIEQKSPHWAAIEAALAIVKKIDEEPTFEPFRIMEKNTAYGYLWRYQYVNDDPERIVDAVRTAVKMAADEARKNGIPYLVASDSPPRNAIYVFDGNHPAANDVAFSVLYELSSDGDCLCRFAPQY